MISKVLTLWGYQGDIEGASFIGCPKEFQGFSKWFQGVLKEFQGILKELEGVSRCLRSFRGSPRSIIHGNLY